MTTIFAVDPGPVESAWVKLANGKPMAWAKEPNSNLFRRVNLLCANLLVIEKVASYGMPVGESVFETVYWTGRFAQFWGYEERLLRITRKQVALHICGSPRANDAAVRQALIDRYGGVGGRRAAVGTKKEPGPLYGMKADCWQALALALTAHETKGGVV